MKDQTHERAREIVEFYLKAKDREILAANEFMFPEEFLKKHKIGIGSRKFTGHSYDIITDFEIVEVDDYGKHSHKSQKINDGIATDYAINYLDEWKFYRLQKEEIVDSKGYLQPTAADYLKKNLF